MLPSDYACPRCKCQACYALHRKGFDWVLSTIGLRPARCLTCGKRFYTRYSIAHGERQTDINPTEQSDSGLSSQLEKGARRRARNVYSSGKSDKAA